MDLNEPKRSEKTLNIFKLILYELKMGLNELKIEPKWTWMSLIKLKFS